MARPSAASSRIEPSEMPANSRPARSPQASLYCTARRLFCAATRMSPSASVTAAESSVRLLGLLDSRRRRIAARRAPLSPLFISIPAAATSSSERISGSRSACSAFFTSGNRVASAPSASTLAAPSRVAASVDSSFNAASASSTAARRRLLTTTSLFFPSISTSPSAKRASTPAAAASPSATSAPMASSFWSLSPLASFCSAARSSARALPQPKKKRAASAALLFSNSTLLFRGHQRRLVLLLFVAGNERAPRLALDRTRRLPDHVELAVGLHFADEHRLVQVVVLLVHLRGNARGRLEGLAGHRRAHLGDVEALRLLGRLLPHVDADVGRLHRVVGQRLGGVRELFRLGIGGPLGYPGIVHRVL